MYERSLSWLGTGTSIKSGVKQHKPTPNPQMFERSLFWLGTGTSIKSGGVKPDLWIK